MNELNGKGRQKCSYCEYKSLRGLKKNNGVCPFHWAKGIWGIEWASKQYPNHPEAKT